MSMHELVQFVLVYSSSKTEVHQRPCTKRGGWELDWRRMGEREYGEGLVEAHKFIALSKRRWLFVSLGKWRSGACPLSFEYPPGWGILSLGTSQW